MEHKGTVTMETERLILRPFRLDDVHPMFVNWASNPEVARYLTWKPHADKETTKAIVSRWIEDYKRPDAYQWAIEWKELGQPIGSIAVVALDENVDACEIGYCIGKPWWGQGVMTEAVKKVMGFLFDEVNVKRICAKHDVNNPNSGKVMAKCGMTYEGTLRHAGKNSLDEICDLAIYATVKD